MHSQARYTAEDKLVIWWSITSINWIYQRLCARKQRMIICISTWLKTRSFAFSYVCCCRWRCRCRCCCCCWATCCVCQTNTIQTINCSQHSYESTHTHGHIHHKRLHNIDAINSLAQNECHICLEINKYKFKWKTTAVAATATAVAVVAGVVFVLFEQQRHKHVLCHNVQFINVFCDLYTEFIVHFIISKKAIPLLSRCILNSYLLLSHMQYIFRAVHPHSHCLRMSVHCRVPQLRLKATPTRIIILSSDVLSFVFLF